MTINIFVLNGDLNGENRSGAFLFLSGICIFMTINHKSIVLQIRMSPFFNKDTAWTSL